MISLLLASKKWPHTDPKPLVAHTPGLPIKHFSYDFMIDLAVKVVEVFIFLTNYGYFIKHLFLVYSRHHQTNTKYVSITDRFLNNL